MAKSNLHRYHFPWRGANRFQLRVDGDDFFPAMLAAIDQAHHFILLEMYLVESGALLDRFIDALTAAAWRDVQVYLLLDDYGARGLNKNDRQRLKRRNIHLAFYNPVHYGQLWGQLWGRQRRALLRDHRKLLLIDNRLAFVGGAGLTDAFDPQQNLHYWHDLMVEIRGPCVVDWYNLFVDNWPGNDPVINLIPPPQAYGEKGCVPQLGRVTMSQMSSRQEIKRSLIKRLRNAEHRIWITTAYFVPSWKLRRALRQAARRGVDVRLILPGPHIDHPAIRQAGQRFYYGLLKHGVRILEYQPRFNHGKAYLCDHWCSVGSSNLDRWNLIWSLEANQEIEDQDFAETLKQAFEKDMHQCVEFHYERWQRRPRYRRLLEWFWGRVDILIHRFTQRH